MPTIVYVEDNPDNAALISRIVKALGFDIIVATTGLAGCEAALYHEPVLVLVDIDLPDMSGFEVAMHLREVEELRKVPFIAITAQVDEGYKYMAKLAGLTGYITKPIQVDLVIKTVQEWAGTEISHSLIDLDLDNEAAVYDRDVVMHLIDKIRELAASNDELRANNRDLIESLVPRLREAQDMNVELRHLDQVKDAFIQRTTHEIRTPLTVIVGYGDMLKNSRVLQEVAATHPEVAYTIQGLLESINRMRKVVDEIVTATRVTTGAFRIRIVPANPYEIIDLAIRPYRMAIQERQIDFELIQPETWPPRVNVDTSMIHTAFTNLISNAIKFTPDGGQVFISVGQVDENTVKFTIRDTGVGIDPSEQERIFERFYSIGDVSLHSTSKTAFLGGGLGVGLSTSKAIIEAHGGQIYVESTSYDEYKLPGSTFYIELPIE